MRSLLFVPGDRPERFVKGAASGADALILDLEDAVTPARKAAARSAVQDCLAAPRIGPPLLVRVNPLGTAECDADLAMLAQAVPPDGLVLPKAEGARSIRTLDARLSESGAILLPILPIATETPAAIFALGSFGEVGRRLLGLSWGAEDLPAAIGAATAREPDGRYTPPYEVARSLALFAAYAAGTPAIDTVFPAFRDEAGLAAYAARAARDGFVGMLAIHPAQIATINAAFTPSAEAVTKAAAIVAAFAAAPGAGSVQLDGRMLDAPHLKQAQRLLVWADRKESRNR